MAVPDVQEILHLLDQGRETDAINRLEPIVAQEPANPSVRILLARAYERAARLGRAPDAWSTALSLAPESTAARSRLRQSRKAYPVLPPAPLLAPPAPAPSRVLEAAGTASIDDENLERLIKGLEEARIVPNPEVEYEEVDLEPVDDDDALVSETLARIYAAQGQLTEAA